MDRLQIVKNTPSELVLGKTLAANAIFRGWGKPLINPLLFLSISFAILYVRSLNNLSSPTWLYWAIGVGVFIVESFTLYIFLSLERKITVTIDLHSRIATRVTKLVIGIEKKTELDLEQVNRILINSEEVGHHCIVMLDSQSNAPLYVSSAVYFEEESLRALGKKIGHFLKKPVVFKLTDGGKLVFEETIQS